MQAKTDSKPPIQDPQQEQPDIWGEGAPAAEQPFQNAPEPAEQALRGAPAEIDDEGTLYVDEESVLRGESKKHGGATDTDIEQDSFPNDPASQENLPFSIPREICLHIFSFLNTQNLQSTALVSRQSYALSAEIRKRHFLKKFSNSHWWKFLVALANNVTGEDEKKFVDVLILGMGPGTRIPNGWREACATISSYVTRWMEWYPDKIQRLGFGVSGYECIQKKAQTLLAMMCPDNDRTQFNACTQLRECFGLVPVNNNIKAFQQYDDLDRLFSCLILFEFMSARPADDRLNFLIRTPFARGLTGEGLIALECQFPGIFPELVREAIRLFQIEEKQEADSQRLEAIERLLGRLTEADILAYINTEAHEPKIRQALLVQRQIFVDVLRSDYEFLMAKLSIAVLLRVERTIGYTEEFKLMFIIPYVIESGFILSRFKPIELLSILKKIRDTEIERVINDHPVLHSFCTVEIMEELLKVDTGRSKLARVFLSNKPLLDKLSDDHIVAFAEHFVSTDFEAALRSEALQFRLRATPDNVLLMKLAKCNQKYSFGKEVLRNLEVSSLLTGDQAIELFDFARYKNENDLIKNQNLMDKLSSSQLLYLLKKCTTSSEVRLIVVKNRLSKFNKLDLIELCKDVFSIILSYNQALCQFLLESLPTEITKRVTLNIAVDYRLDSKALCELCCTHQQMGCHILDHYGELLETDEFTGVFKHYQSYDRNSPIYLSIKKEELKRLKRMHPRDRITENTKGPGMFTITLLGSPSLNRKAPKRHHESKDSSLLTETEWSWVYYILQLMCVVGAVIGLLLAISGIGFALGISIIVTLTQFLFTVLPASHALVAGIFGFGIFIASSIGWLITDEAKKNRLELKNNSYAVDLDHPTHNPQFRKPHVDALKTHKGLSVSKDSTTNKQVDLSRSDTEDEILVDLQSCLNIYNK